MEAILKQEIEQYYREEKPRLLTYVQGKINNWQAAEDVVQETFLKALTQLNTLEPIENLLGWLYTAARNRIIDWYRNKTRQLTQPIDELEIEDTSIEALLAETGLDLEIQWSKELLIDALIDAIAALPKDQRNIIIMQSLEGLTFREIAQIEQVSINTLLARKRYALATLRKRLAHLKTIITESQK
jgi:RNA polymerase sigma factor (sigma-70 family)